MTTKEKPILFSSQMVKAILEDRKTQTRRIVKPQPPFGCEYGINGAESHALCSKIGNPSIWVPPAATSTDNRIACQHGRPGDRLWVRETHHVGGNGAVHYRADYDGNPFNEDECGEDCSLVGEKWKPSIFMRRAHSRLTLEITAVRVERLQDISEEDAKAEGVEPHAPDDGRYVAGYKELWETINKSWEPTIWVWVIQFKKL